MDYRNDANDFSHFELLLFRLGLKKLSPLSPALRSGTGDFSCNSCNYREKIIFYIHGIGTHESHRMGYQCQKCGKFTSILNARNMKRIRACECGGRLRSNKPLFCPECRDKDVRVSLGLLT